MQDNITTKHTTMTHKIIKTDNIKKNTKAKNSILLSLSESLDYTIIADDLYNKSTPKEIIECLEVLLEKYANQKLLLHKFFQHKSDACSLEATEMEIIENDFEEYVILNHIN